MQVNSNERELTLTYRKVNLRDIINNNSKINTRIYSGSSTNRIMTSGPKPSVGMVKPKGSMPPLPQLVSISSLLSLSFIGKKPAFLRKVK